MPLSQPDDPARHFREVWVGAKGVGPWPVQARFGMWGLAFALWPFSFILLWLVVAKILLLLVGAAVALRYVRRQRPDQMRLAWIGAGAGFLLALSFKLDVEFWFLPMHWGLGIVAAPALALFLTSRIAPYVDRNIPLGYRVALLFKAAHRPRRRRAELNIAVKDEVLATSDGVDLNDYRPLSFTKVKP